MTRFALTLEKLGFFKDTIMETIVSTYDERGRPNAAPMGVIAIEPRKILIRPHVSSSTYRNLMANRCAVVNVTSDPVMFFYTAFKEANIGGSAPLDWFEKAKTVNAPRLKSADAIIEVSVSEIKPSNFFAEFSCDVKFVWASKVLPRAYCRAYFATIEAIIHATRVKSFLTSNSAEREKAASLINLIKHYQEITNRVAPNSKCSEIMANLIGMIESWEQNEGLR